MKYIDISGPSISTQKNHLLTNKVNNNNNKKFNDFATATAASDADILYIANSIL